MKCFNELTGDDKKILFNNAEVLDFAEKVKFKTATTNTYTYFNVSAEYQIRITKNKRTGGSKGYYLTIHEQNEDGIGYKTEYMNNILVIGTLKEAKITAGEIYWYLIRNEYLN